MAAALIALSLGRGSTLRQRAYHGPGDPAAHGGAQRLAAGRRARLRDAAVQGLGSGFG